MILLPLVALGYWSDSCVNTAKSFHAHVQEKFGHLSIVSLPSIMLVIRDLVLYITLLSGSIQTYFEHGHGMTWKY